MTETPPRVALLGECMLELSPVADRPGQYQLGVAGDTFNTATGLARLGLPVSYLTGLGDDHHSDDIAGKAADAGIDMTSVERLPGYRPGLYLIDNAPDGERSFSYWRENSAARETLGNARRLLRLLDRAGEPDYLFISGITLALCGDDGREALRPWLNTYQAGGGLVTYDGNYRAALWSSPGAATEAHRQLAERADIYLPGIEDELELRGLEDKLALTSELESAADREIVLKDGAAGVQLFGAAGSTRIAAEPVDDVVDTSGAGDAFNAGYLAARLHGLSPATAAAFGCRVAAATIQVPGAVLPADGWPPLRADLDQLVSEVDSGA